MGSNLVLQFAPRTASHRISTSYSIQRYFARKRGHARGRDRQNAPRINDDERPLGKAKGKIRWLEKISRAFPGAIYHFHRPPFQPTCLHEAHSFARRFRTSAAGYHTNSTHGQVQKGHYYKEEAHRFASTSHRTWW